MKIVKGITLFIVVVVGLGTAYIYSGMYPMGADVPHNKLTYWLLETIREQSVERSSKDITIPPLDDPMLLLAGGPDYNDMCVSCHLKPGRVESDMSLGLYPMPPNLSLHADQHGHQHGDESHGDKSQGDGGSEDSGQSLRRQFWIIKHGIKASGMPAWGPTHDDQRIWAMVAFLQKLPELTPDQYQILTARDEMADSLSH